MAIDPSIYQQLNTGSVAGGLADTLNDYSDRQTRLSQLAQQQELTGQQIRAGQRAEAAIPAQQAEAQRAQKEKHMQELSSALAFGIQQKNGISNQELMNSTYNEAMRRGLNDQDVARLFQPWASVSNQTDGVVVDPTAMEQQGVADVYAQRSNPQEAIKQRLEAMNKENKTESLFSKIDPAKYTSESVMQFAKTKDYTSLVPRDKSGTSEGAFAKISPDKFTSPSISKFTQTGNYADLIPRKETETPEAAKKRIVEIEMKLSDDYRAESKGWAETSTSMKKALAAMDNADKNPGSALAAGTAFMKILDPNSVVRETELGMALNASGWFDRAGNVAQKLQLGVVMTPEQQKQLKAASIDLFEEAKKAQLEIDSAYESRAKDYGANPKHIITQRGQNLPDTRPKKDAPQNPIDNEAVTWAKANKNDPRSAQILKMNGQ